MRTASASLSGVRSSAIRSASCRGAAAPPRLRSTPSVKSVITLIDVVNVFDSLRSMVHARARNRVRSACGGTPKSEQREGTPPSGGLASAGRAVEASSSRAEALAGASGGARQPQLQVHRPHRAVVGQSRRRCPGPPRASPLGAGGCALRDDYASRITPPPLVAVRHRDVLRRARHAHLGVRTSGRSTTASAPAARAPLGPLRSSLTSNRRSLLSLPFSLLALRCSLFPFSLFSFPFSLALFPF